jgi:hypothetical protein
VSTEHKGMPLFLPQYMRIVFVVTEHEGIKSCFDSAKENVTVLSQQMSLIFFWLSIRECHSVFSQLRGKFSVLTMQ